MNKRFGPMMVALTLGAIGCTTTNPEQKYTADSPPPLVGSARGEKGSSTVIDAVRLAPARTQVSKDDIDESNVMDSVRKLEGEMNAEKRASARAGR